VESSLSGGRTFGAVRSERGVHRPVQPSTPAVHALLRHLEAVGFAGAPRVVGLDDEGREVVTYLDGEVVGENWPWPTWALADDTLRQVGGWLRRLHDATRTFTPPADAVWFTGEPWRPGSVIAHNDVAPWNAVWRDGTLVGIVDWELASPSTPEFDLAFAALTWVPLLARRLAVTTGFTAFDDRSRRLRLLLDAYGYEGDRGAFGAVVAARARRNAEVIHHLAADGTATFTAMLPWAADLELSATEAEELPESFWTHAG
jgi:Ser/Thr protein kinase RdoA (MazF antagonist)